MEPEWTDQHEGKVRNRTGSTVPIFSLHRGIQEALRSYLISLVKWPGLTLDDSKWAHPYMRSHILISLSLIYPRIDQEKQRWLVRVIRTVTLGFFGFRSEEWRRRNPESNFWFLLDISMKRNWRTFCGICLNPLEDWSETVMFRPCGHVVCGHCFAKLAPVASKELNECCNVEWGSCGRVKFASNNIVRCPFCRQSIQSAFRPQVSRPNWVFDVQVPALINSILSIDETEFDIARDREETDDELD